MFLKELLQTCTERGLNGWLHLGTDQFLLGLRGEAGIRHLHRQDRDHAFAHVVAGQVDLGLLGDAVLFDVIAQGAGQRGAETGQMGTAVLLGDVVGEAEHRFLVSVGPLQRHVHGDAVGFAGHRNDVRVQRGLQLGQVLDEAANAAFVLEDILAAFAAFVDQGDLDARVEERQLAQAAGQDVVMELDVGEDFGRRPETGQRTALARGFQLLQRIDRLAEPVFLLVVETIAPDVEGELVRQRIDHRDADAVQAA